MDDGDSENPTARGGARPGVTMLPRPGGGGFAAEGPGFYVWEETPRETRASAAELLAVVPETPR